MAKKHKQREPLSLVRASEHLLYEWKMLNVLADALDSGIAGNAPIHNAFLEAFVIHARALVSFFYPPPEQRQYEDDILPSHFTDKWPEVCPAETPTLKNAREMAHKLAAHLTYKRVDLPDDKKVWQYRQIVDDLTKVMDKFIETVSRKKLCEEWKKEIASQNRANS